MQQRIMPMEVGSVEPWAFAYLKAVLNDPELQEALCRYVPTDVGSQCVPAGMFERTLSFFQEHSPSHPSTPSSGGERDPARPQDEDRFKGEGFQDPAPGVADFRHSGCVTDTVR